MAYNITHIKTKTGEYLQFCDKEAIRGIKFSDSLESPKNEAGYYIANETGYITVKQNKYSTATHNSIGMVIVPELLDNGILKNDIEINNGSITVDIPIKTISDSEGQLFNKSNATKNLVIRTLSNDILGLAKTNLDSGYCIKQDEGYLYVKFSNGWTDIDKEKNKLDFQLLIDNGSLSLGEYN